MRGEKYAESRAFKKWGRHRKLWRFKEYKEYLNEDGTEFSLPLDEGKYTEDDIEINTNYINLNNCPYYNKNAKADEFDCSIDKNKICLY